MNETNNKKLLILLILLVAIVLTLAITESSPIERSLSWKMFQLLSSWMPY